MCTRMECKLPALSLRYAPSIVLGQPSMLQQGHVMPSAAARAHPKYEVSAALWARQELFSRFLSRALRALEDGRVRPA